MSLISKSARVLANHRCGIMELRQVQGPDFPLRRAVGTTGRCERKRRGKVGHRGNVASAFSAYALYSRDSLGNCAPRFGRQSWVVCFKHRRLV